MIDACPGLTYGASSDLYLQTTAKPTKLKGNIWEIISDIFKRGEKRRTEITKKMKRKKEKKRGQEYFAGSTEVVFLPIEATGSKSFIWFPTHSFQHFK